MRTLKFIVDKQLVTPDPNCDFSGLIPGTEGYIQADFTFSSEWNHCTKVAAFYSMMGREYSPQVLKDGHTCIIPSEALVNKAFQIQLIGGRDAYKITTNKLTISQNGGTV